MFPFFVKNDILNKCVFSEIRTVPFLLKEFLNKHIFDFFFFIHFLVAKSKGMYTGHIFTLMHSLNVKKETICYTFKNSTQNRQRLILLKT